MFLLDSLMISGIRWALQTLATTAEAEMNDDAAVRAQLLEAEMRREMGELSDEEFRHTEAALLARIREIRERRKGGTGPSGFAASASGDQDVARFRVEASLTGEFHEPPTESSASTSSGGRGATAVFNGARPTTAGSRATRPRAYSAKPRRRKQTPPAASRARKPRT
jgi:hypothetical protein